MILHIQPWTHSGGKPVPALTPTQRDAITYLRSPAAIRERCQQVLALACADRLHHFAYHPDKLPEFAIGFPNIRWYDKDKAAKIGGAQ